MSCKEDATACQLQEFYDKNGDLGFATTSSGNPALNQTASLTAGKDGPILLGDWELIDNLQSFDRERIPERVVHAKGSGAFGYFECTHDITHLTIAKPFDKVGKKTPIAARFSTVAGGQGSADTVRDPRGFAVKFYTEDGNWDLTGNNTPIFFMRDPMLFPLFIHSQKMNPQTGVRSWDQFWDWIGLRPESTHQVMFLFSDRGIPKGYRYMHGFGSHTFSFINKDRELNYVKFHFRTDQGIENIPPAEAQELAGADADYARRELYNAIKNGDNPSWTLYVQVMPESDVEEVSKRYDPFDVTKVWPHGDYPLQQVGKMVLNRNATNFFAEIEQLAFTPSSLIPGVGASPDRMLQGRLFSYGDTHLHRLGKNYNQLPVNCPYRVRNTQRDGAATIDNQGGAPNYIPNSFGGPNNDSRYKKYYYYQYVQGQSGRYDTRDNDNYSQPRIFWTKVLNDETRKHLVDNIVSTLKFAQEPIQNNVVKNFAAVHADFGKMLTQGLKDTKITI